MNWSSALLVLTVTSVGAVITETNSDIRGAEIEANNYLFSTIINLPAFDSRVEHLPEAQLMHIRRVTFENFEIIRNMLLEGIEIGKNPLVLVPFMKNYSSKLIKKAIADREQELQLEQMLQFAPDFFEIEADLIRSIISRSRAVKDEKGYTKDNINTDFLYLRFDGVLNHLQDIIDTSPLGSYLKWHEIVNLTHGLWRKDSSVKISLYEDVTDLVAQFRAIGFDSVSDLGKAYYKLLFAFARNTIPKASEVLVM